LIVIIPQGARAADQQERRACPQKSQGLGPMSDFFRHQQPESRGVLWRYQRSAFELVFAGKEKISSIPVGRRDPQKISVKI